MMLKTITTFIVFNGCSVIFLYKYVPYPVYMWQGKPFTPSPVTLNTDPVSGNFSASSSTQHVTYNSSFFVPPKQQDVIRFAGISTVLICFPEEKNVYLNVA